LRWLLSWALRVFLGHDVGMVRSGIRADGSIMLRRRVCPCLLHGLGLLGGRRKG